MKELEKIEAELKELTPLSPSKNFTAKLEEALGDAGNVAMCHMPHQDGMGENNQNDRKVLPKNVLSLPHLFKLIGVGALAIAAVWVVIFHISSAVLSNGSADHVAGERTQITESPSLAVQSLQADDPDSPLHGLSLEDLQDVSVMPVSGWSDPQINERFLRMVDEGVFDRPGYLPARRVRNYYMDETLWSHPASDLRILSTSPREEVIFIELETY